VGDALAVRDRRGGDTGCHGQSGEDEHDQRFLFTVFLLTADACR
jgi:hypothetical protein